MAARELGDEARRPPCRAARRAARRRRALAPLDRGVVAVVAVGVVVGARRHRLGAGHRPYKIRSGPSVTPSVDRGPLTSCMSTNFVLALMDRSVGDLGSLALARGLRHDAAATRPSRWTPERLYAEAKEEAAAGNYEKAIKLLRAPRRPRRRHGARAAGAARARLLPTGRAARRRRRCRRSSASSSCTRPARRSTTRSTCRASSTSTTTWACSATSRARTSPSATSRRRATRTSRSAS